MVIGHESGGVVLQVGSEVNHLRPGDVVAMEPGVSCGEYVLLLFSFFFLFFFFFLPFFHNSILLPLPLRLSPPLSSPSPPPFQLLLL